jgi:hypothetical protein
MGCCSSCLEGSGAETKESEMTSKSGASSKGKNMSISRKMSAPAIEIKDVMQVGCVIVDT